MYRNIPVKHDKAVLEEEKRQIELCNQYRLCDDIDGLSDSEIDDREQALSLVFRGKELPEDLVTRLKECLRRVKK